MYFHHISNSSTLSMCQWSMHSAQWSKFRYVASVVLTSHLSQLVSDLRTRTQPMYLEAACHIGAHTSQDRIQYKNNYTSPHKPHSHLPWPCIVSVICFNFFIFLSFTSSLLHFLVDGKILHETQFYKKTEMVTKRYC